MTTSLVTWASECIFSCSQKYSRQSSDQQWISIYAIGSDPPSRVVRGFRYRKSPRPAADQSAATEGGLSRKLASMLISTGFFLEVTTCKMAAPEIECFFYVISIELQNQNYFLVVVKYVFVWWSTGFCMTLLHNYIYLMDARWVSP